MRNVREIGLLFSLACGLLSWPMQAQGQSVPARARTAADTKTAEQVKEDRQRTRRLAADAKWYYEFGVELGRAQKYDEAIKAFRRALMFRPDYVDAYFGLGRAYADLGRWQEASDAFEQVLRLAPEDAEAMAWLGRIYLKSRAEKGAQPAAGAGAAALASVDATRAVGEKAGNSATPSADTILRPRPAAAGGASSVPSATADTRDLTKLYRVGPGDVLWIRLLNAPVQNQPTLYNVLADGRLDYPLAGEPQPVAGLTTGEIAARLLATPMLRAVSEAPRLLVGVRDYASHTINVAGLVDDPGEKVLRSEALPLYVVLAAALPQPAAGQVLIVSQRNGRRTVPYDLTNRETMNSLIYPGDQVTVEAAPPQFITVEGLIRQPGQKKFHPGLTLTQALLAAGGVQETDVRLKKVKQTDEATVRSRYTVVLMHPDKGEYSTYDLQDIETGKAPDLLLRPGDKLTVRR